MTAPLDHRAFEAPALAGPPPPIAAAELLSALRRRWAVVALSGLLALGLAAAALSRLPERYVAQAELMLESRAPRLAFDAVLPEPALDAQAVASEIRLVQSQRLLAEVVRTLRLTEDAAFGAARSPGTATRLRAAAEAWARARLGWAPPAPPPPETARGRELRAVAALRRALSVSRQGESRVIAVQVESEDAATAALLANAVADRYVVDQLQAKFEATERAAVFLTDRLGEVSARLEAAEAAAEAARAGAAAGPAGAQGAIRRRMAETAAALAGAEGRRAAALRGAMAALEREAGSQARTEIALRQAEREVAALSSLHEAILARLKETRVQAGLERPDARLIAEAAPPQEPAAANARLVLALSLAAGLAFGASAAFVLESAGGVHHSAEAAERESGLPVLAALPRARDPVAQARSRPASRLAEAVRELRAGVLAGVEGPVTIAVLSPGPGEGKSSLAAMLAESCARLGRRTLLVDADLRNPSQAARFGLSGEEDLGALLEGAALPEEVIWEDPETGLSVLPAQPAPARRAELLAGPAFQAVLAGLRGRFEVIVIDTPPLLAVADARLAAAAADRSVLALRWGRTTRAETRAALRALGEAGARVAGLALTATPAGGDPRPGRDGRGGRYGRFAEYFED